MKGQGRTRSLIWDNLDYGWRTQDGRIPREDEVNAEGMFQTEWGKQGHIKWRGPKELILHDGSKGPSVPWGSENADPLRLMYGVDHSSEDLRGRALVRTCDFHSLSGGDSFCMNLEHTRADMVIPDRKTFYSMLCRIPIDAEEHGGCWVWTGPTQPQGGKAVPVFRCGGRQLLARTMAYNYEFPKKPIPPGSNLRRDSECHELCVNPLHHKIVTMGGPKPGAGRRPSVLCVRGHSMDLSDPRANVYLDDKGHKHCRICNSLRQEAHRHKKAMMGMTEEQRRLWELAQADKAQRRALAQASRYNPEEDQDDLPQFPVDAPDPDPHGEIIVATDEELDEESPEYWERVMAR